MSPSNLADMKISHALALSTLLFGEQGEAFRLLNDDIQDTVHWLLNVTLREAVAACMAHLQRRNRMVMYE